MHAKALNCVRNNFFLCLCFAILCNNLLFCYDFDYNPFVWIELETLNLSVRVARQRETLCGWGPEARLTAPARDAGAEPPDALEI